MGNKTSKNIKNESFNELHSLTKIKNNNKDNKSHNKKKNNIKSSSCHNISYSVSDIVKITNHQRDMYKKWKLDQDLRTKDLTKWKEELLITYQELMKQREKEIRNLCIEKEKLQKIKNDQKNKNDNINTNDSEIKIQNTVLNKRLNQILSEKINLEMKLSELKIEFINMKSTRKKNISRIAELDKNLKNYIDDNSILSRNNELYKKENENLMNKIKNKENEVSKLKIENEEIKNFTSIDANNLNDKFKKSSIYLTYLEYLCFIEDFISLKIGGIFLTFPMSMEIKLIPDAEEYLFKKGIFWFNPSKIIGVNIIFEEEGIKKLEIACNSNWDILENSVCNVISKNKEYEIDIKSIKNDFLKINVFKRSE